MRFKKPIYLSFSFLIILPVVLFPGTANAATSGSTSLTLVINPYSGGLAISAPASAVFTPLISPEFATGAPLILGTLVVTDTRRSVGAAGSWTTDAVADDLVSGGDTLAANTFSYSSGVFVKTGGTALMTENTRTSLSTAGHVVSTTAVTGNHVVTWTPTMTIFIPASQASGTYTGTITHSVS